MFRPHMGHHQSTFIIGETTAPSVPLGTSLIFLLNSFIGHFHHTFLAAISVFFFKSYTFIVYTVVLSSLVLQEKGGGQD
jgi:hypothetical protein